MIFGRARATATAMFGGLVLSIAGCSDLPGPDGTNLGEQLQFSEEIDLQQFEDLLGNRVRVEIRLGDGLVASRVEVRNNGDAEEDEQISAPVSAAEISGNAGVITLDVGDLAIDFDENTAIVVRGDEFEVMGQGYVAIYDHNRQLDSGGRFYFLASGDRYDLETREPSRPVRRFQGFDRLVKRAWP